MKIICTQENLNKGLNLVSNIANKNSNLLILNNVLLRADKDGLILITTDLEVGIKAFVRSKIEDPGAFTVDAKLLNNFIGLLPKENIELFLQDNDLSIKNKNQQTTIKGLEAEDFPLIPEIEKENELIISSSDLKKSLGQVITAASTDSSRIEINAVNFCFKKDQLILAATDSYRLAEKIIKITNGQEANLIIPLKTLQELLKILNEEEEQKVKVYFKENQILFTFNSVELVSRVIDGKYPDYSQIIPESFATSAKCDLNKLVPAIKAVALFCKQGINDIRLSFDEHTQEIIVATASSNTGKSVARVSAKVDGNNNEVVFNYRYLLDGLNHIKTSDVILQINNNSSPGLLKPTDSQNYIYLVMPIRQ
ncbi:MAG: DNA polymerase III subunit beta [Candidatus Komeilibacteria bacterium CG11_big_fil_rev_8_21_14_0_20_36_20]|uniref:Beta sliding clamp n=1 Tax=Candidatus Komeilibacteria bacterium CG11_big_fil_rev_8_21_14_0_20_36_20 TaxID=1974477 RepID=A0A2H0NES6_9BACT|nr:MAG: DNA polymerase III subunit beta [Candidatus Komeilibacteria bacterium CG11_big_fil_rev_8_21_14_0_20_36_20]PIR81919.1 MAG: DNA polymerase III subunit beta [Candidatus Komeilibacteria bacterium CG10_big_fil_rev_8_21_14_0_10_36_65]PJC55354.1 MAG: DNA polymerase III subunit beta [Candidatus Komeilibacteria bacterium CG_4_9_14_0_2_um_filter_36_13]